jgi:hypothetical protein
MAGLREGLEAEVADVGFVVSVRPLAPIEIVLPREGLEAEVADVGFVISALVFVLLHNATSRIFDEECFTFRWMGLWCMLLPGYR